MNRNNDNRNGTLTSTQQILLGLVTAAVIIDPAAANEAAIKMAREEKERQKILKAEMQQQQAKALKTQPTKSKTHHHKNSQSKAHMKRY